MLDLVEEHRRYGGVQRKHESESIGLPMRFGVFACCRVFIADHTRHHAPALV
jgi:hypothetical protein